MPKRLLYKQHNEERGNMIGEIIKIEKTIRLPAELCEAIRREADERGYTAHDLIMFVLWNSLKDTARL